MRRRQVLALSIATVAGCSGSNTVDGGPDDTSTSTATTSSTDTTVTSRTETTTNTTSPSTTVESCSTDLEIENPPEKPSNLSSAAESVVAAVEEPVARGHLDPDSYFHFWLRRVSTTDIDGGVRLDAKAEVDYSYSGDGEDATTVHAHYRYPVTYRLTDRRVVREAADQGPTGTVVCW